MKSQKALVGFSVPFAFCNFALALSKTVARSSGTASATRMLPLVLLLALPASMQAQFTFTTNNGRITITGYMGPVGAVTIPDMTNGYPVTSIGDRAFYATGLTSVTIPNSVTNIADWAFAACRWLPSVTIPNSVINIGAYAFFVCPSLGNVTIPAGVTNIGGASFAGCMSLTNIMVDPLNAFYSSLGGVLLNKQQTTLIQCPGAKSGNYIIPNSVSTIGDTAFLYCASLSSVAIPGIVTRIGKDAFYSCWPLTSVMIPNSVTNVGDRAFYACYGLTRVYFQGKAPSLGSDVFSSDTTTVYYLPGTTGWGPTSGGRPAVLWNPWIQTTDASFGVLSNQFGFTITGTTNIPIVVEASTNLASASWSPLQTCTLTNGSIYFSDPAWTNHPARFYRIRSP